MLRAIAAYLFGLPVVMLAFWSISAMLYPPAQSTPFLAMVFSAAYFAPLLLMLGLPGLLVLVAWAGSLGSRVWPVGSALASAAVLATYAYSNNVMCRVAPTGPDCLGNIGFQLAERSPFGAEYAMIFWATTVSSLAFWLAYMRATRCQPLSPAVRRAEPPAQ